MTRQEPKISAQLLTLDAPDAAGGAGRELYEQKLRTLFERRLSAADWVRLSLMGAGGVAGAAVCGVLALTEPAGMPVRTRAALAVLALIGLSWAGLAGLIVRRRSVHSAVHGTAAATMGFAYALLATTAIGVMSVARPVSPGLLLLPVTVLVLATVVLVVHHVRQSELRVRREVLEIGYRLAREAGPAEG